MPQISNYLMKLIYNHRFKIMAGLSILGAGLMWYLSKKLTGEV